MIEIKATTEKDGYVKTVTTLNGNPSDVAAELAAINADILSRLKPATAVNAAALAHAVINDAIAMLDERKEVGDNGSN